MVPKAAAEGTQNWDFAAMMIGSGDARNLFATFIDLAAQLRQYDSPVDTKEKLGVGPRVHFTLVSQ